MGVCVLVMGESGSGKSTSLRNFKRGEVGVFNVCGKMLPFKSDIPVQNVPGFIVNNFKYKSQSGKELVRSNISRNPYDFLREALPQKKAKSIVVDDSQYLMAFELFNRAKESGYEKFTEIGVNFYHLIQLAMELPPEKIVYFLHHIDTDSTTGKIKAKTIGKMLDEKICLEGLFTIVLLCKTDGPRHWFEVQTDGNTTVKTPIGMFDDGENTIDNDLKYVDRKIREFWNLPANEVEA